MESQYRKCQMIEPNEPSKAKKPRKRRNNASASSEVTIMDEHIWEKLPDDVLEGVIARLPIATFFRSRLVCRKWNSLLHSHRFLQHFCAHRAQNPPWFYIVTTETVEARSIYDPLMKKWRHFTDIRSLDLYPAASAGGLICCFDLARKSMFVCNPLTQIRKELPFVRAPWFCGTLGMIMNKDSVSRGYQIVWLSDNGDYKVYDSFNNSWLSQGKISADIRLPITFGYRTNTVSIDNVVYFLRSYPPGLVSYDLASGVWEQFMIPLPDSTTEISLAECGGRILMVGLVKHNEATSVCVWELERTMLVWTEIDRMPNLWCLEFNGKSMDLICLGNKRLLMLLLSWRNMNRIFTYDAVSREWSQVSKCVLPGQTRRQLMRSGVVFTPCLADIP